MIKLFTHTDLYGIGCAILAYYTFGKDRVDVEFCDYDDIDSKVNDFYKNEYLKDHLKYYVFITDISISDEIAEKINSSQNRHLMMLLDHHSTALLLNKYDWCKINIVDNRTGLKTSGTEMLYRFLADAKILTNNKAIKNFVELVRNYDTWHLAEIEDGLICKQVNDLMHLHGRDYFIDWCLNQLKIGTFPTLYPEDNMLLNTKQKEIDEYITQKDETMFLTELCGRPCGVIFADKYVSELGNKLCTIHPEIDFVVMIDLADCTVSYRSVKDDIKLGEDIASKFGGGGHPKAAGSKFSQDMQKKIFELIFRK